MNETIVRQYKTPLPSNNLVEDWGFAEKSRSKPENESYKIKKK